MDNCSECINEQFLSESTDGGLTENVFVNLVVLAYRSLPGHQLHLRILFLALLIPEYSFMLFPACYTDYSARELQG